MGIKLFNCLAIPDFMNVVGQNGPNSNSEMDESEEVVLLKHFYPLFYSHFFENVRSQEKISLSLCVSPGVVITWKTTGLNWLQSLWHFLHA